MRQLASILSFLLLLAGGLRAQQDNTSLPLFHRIQQQHAPAQGLLHIFVKGNPDLIRSWCTDHNAHFKYSRAGWHALSLPAEEASDLSRQPYVRQLSIPAGPVHPLNDTMRVQNIILPIHNGITPLDTNYKGKDVIIGYIDSGIDIDHPDFQYVDGRTRVLAIWDQTVSPGPNTPQPYGYGQEWDSTDINAGNCPHEDQNGFFGHGSSVAGIGSGNGNATGKHIGAAPKSDIVVVSNNFSSSQATVADGVDYITRVADSLGKPCVINVSLGSYRGSHDAKDAVAQSIESTLSAQKGRIMVAAAGNAGNVPPFHLEYDVTTDTNFTWFKYNNNSALGTGGVVFELWADTAEFQQVRYAMGADKTTGGYAFRDRTDFFQIQNNLDTTLRDTLKNDQDDILAIFDFWGTRMGDRYLLQVVSVEPDSSQYAFRFMTTGSGHFDVWSSNNGILNTSRMIPSDELPDAGTFPDIDHYHPPDTLSSMVSSWACSPKVITVGNYTGRISYTDVDGNLQTMPNKLFGLHSSSSLGPTRTDSIKPDIAATGNTILAASDLDFIDQLISSEPYKVAQDSFHVRNGGTSMASPVVAGIAALYLEQCPKGTPEELLSLLQNNAREDSYTGTTPNPYWGHGKVNAFASLTDALPQPEITPTGDLVLCEGDSVGLSATPGYADYSWSNGDSTAFIYVKESASNQVRASTASGCRNEAEPVQTFLQPAPPQPPLLRDGDTLYTTSSTGYQWYHNDQPLPGATGQSYQVDSAGSYFVRITDQNDCWAHSDTNYVSPLSISERSETAVSLRISPNPTSSKLTLHAGPSSHPPIRWTLSDPTGHRLQEGTLPANHSLQSIDLNERSPGIYFLQTSWEKGTRTFKVLRQ